MESPKAEIAELERALLALDRLRARALLSPTGDPTTAMARIEALLVPAMEHIGENWEQGQVALSQVYMSGRICEGLVDALLPAAGSGRKDQPKLAVAVLEDYHLLGKRMVYSALRASGYALLDYGRIDVVPLAQRAVEDGVEVLLVSTLMLPSALRVGALRSELMRLGSPAKIVVGGAPFRLDERLWREVGADAAGTSAADAVAIVDRLSGGPVR